MKKLYMSPETLSVKIITNTMMLATSDPNVTVDPDADPIDPNEVESRKHYNAWEDEEEEEDF